MMSKTTYEVVHYLYKYCGQMNKYHLQMGCSYENEI